MLTSLDFLDKGQTFPPLSEIPRLKGYRENELLFNGDHSEVFKDVLARIARNEFMENINIKQYEILLDYPQKVSLKTADLCVGEAPQIIAGKDKIADNDQMRFVADLAENSNLNNTLHQIVIDLSRYGSAVFAVTNTRDKKPVIRVMSVKNWYPVLNPSDFKEVIAHVFCFEFEKGKDRFLQSTIYYPDGRIEKSVNRLHENIIGNFTETTSTIKSEYGETVYYTHNVETSECFFGRSDYDSFQSILAELEVRFGQVAKILDKFSNPSLQGDPSALLKDEKTGKPYFVAGQYYGVKQDGVPLQYLVWNADLQANFTMIDKLKEELLIHSEMGALFDTAKLQSAASGEALKRLLLNVLAKTNRVKMYLQTPLKRAIKAAALGKGLVIDELRIIFQDGLPNDLKESAEVEATRLQSGNTSVKSSLMRIDKLSEEEAEDEYQRILNEKSELEGMYDGTYVTGVGEENEDSTAEEADPEKE